MNGPITNTRVWVPASLNIVPKRGKPQNFTDEQNAILRRVARDYIAKNALGQEAFGAQLDVGQQTISSFQNGKTGLSYPTASKLSMLAIGEGVDTLFARYGTAPFKMTEIDAFPERAKAFLAARLVGVDETIMQQMKIAPEWNRSELANRPSAWWFEMIRAEQTVAPGMTKNQFQAALREENRVRAEAKNAPPTASEPKPTRRAKTA